MLAKRSRFPSENGRELVDRALDHPHGRECSLELRGPLGLRVVQGSLESVERPLDLVLKCKNSVRLVGTCHQLLRTLERHVHGDSQLPAALLAEAGSRLIANLLPGSSTDCSRVRPVLKGRFLPHEAHGLLIKPIRVQGTADVGWRNPSSVTGHGFQPTGASPAGCHPLFWSSNLVLKDDGSELPEV